jgi:glycosyltransferase involved in cell wall biosynthesis
VVWLLPVKNGMPYLSETLESIERQTYRNWEILAWDNGSTDGTIEELLRWIPNRLPGRLVKDCPLSLSESRAALVTGSQCELLANIDGDDINHPERLERQVDFMLSHPDVSACSCHFNRIDEQGHRLNTVKVPLTHNDIVNRLLWPSPICNTAAIMRRSMVLDVGNFRRHDVGEDFDLWLRLAAKYKLGNVDFCGLDYRIHSNSTIRVSVKNGKLKEATASCAADSGPCLFGAKAEDLERLFNRKHSFALPLIVSIAKHLDQTQGGKTRLRSRSFLRSARRLIHERDRTSQLAVFMMRIFST